MGEDRTAAHPLDVHREDYLAIARAVDNGNEAIRDRIADLLETRDEVCARDAIRIASAWVRDKPTPKNYRLK
jgi:hypothetical protein